MLIKHKNNNNHKNNENNSFAFCFFFVFVFGSLYINVIYKSNGNTNNALCTF